ncbi:Leukocyte receptor cluster member 1 [Chelonia mydas]|uniref:Leukocyte receptor cluster member 1 n=1 Tax=Chelonia mydas TaxID=8469 RepID=M7AK83_CHEMY|nr:Leukocyte receptor cluster member 1 [Chelonia mydas]
MNILPKKSWHVRNKDNVARVRRDEAQAQDEQRQREARALLAEQEASLPGMSRRQRGCSECACARTEFLRKKARVSALPGPDGGSALAPSGEAPRHVDLFRDLEEGKGSTTGNKEYEEEKRREKAGSPLKLSPHSHELPRGSCTHKAKTSPSALFYISGAMIGPALSPSRWGSYFFKVMQLSMLPSLLCPNQERQEKAIGLLTYLGQSAAEAQTSRPWYQEAPNRSQEAATVTTQEQLKGRLDPLREMERHLRKKKGEGKKRKKEKEKPAGEKKALG